MNERDIEREISAAYTAGWDDCRKAVIDALTVAFEETTKALHKRHTEKFGNS